MRLHHLLIWVVAILLLSACGERRNEASVIEEASERALKGIEDARNLQEQSPWQPPGETAVREAIVAAELGKTEIRTFELVKVTRPDEFQKVTAAVRINGEMRSYELSRDASGRWSARRSDL